MRPIHEVDEFKIYAATKQVAKYLDGLDGASWNRFLVALEVLATSLATGRPPAGRSQVVHCSEPGVHELKLNLPGGPGPQHRVIYIREGTRILLIWGLVKKQRALPKREVEAAVRAVTAFRQKRSGEREEPGPRDAANPRRKGQGRGRRRGRQQGA